jgi:hypothetical protein
MKTNFKRFLPYGLAMALTVILIIAVAACSSPSTPAPFQTAPSTPPAATGTPAQPAPSGSNAPSPRQGGGANGTLTKIDGNTLSLNTQQGQIIVNISANTAIQKTVAGSLDDLQTGQILTVMGTADTSGNIAASSIAVRPQGQNPGFTPPAGGTAPNPSGRPNRPSGTPSPRPNMGGPGTGTFGTLAKIDGNTLTLTTVQGQPVTVTLSSSTVIQKTVSGSISDLQVGISLTAMGNRDASGNINAVSISIRPPGASPTGT